MRLPLDTIYITNRHGTIGFGYFGRHAGWDLRASIGTPVYAKSSGIVTERYTGSSGTKVLSVRYGNLEHRYLHLNEMFVNVGDRVSEGQVIATTGNSGNVLAHLHEDIRKQGTSWTASYSNYYDPLIIYKDLLQGKDEDMITKEDIAELRIVHSEVGGWPLHETHQGKHDSKFLGAWVGKSWKEFIFKQWADKNSAKFRARRENSFANQGTYAKEIESLRKENNRLKAQVGGNTELNVLGRALASLLDTLGYKKQ